MRLSKGKVRRFEKLPKAEQPSTPPPVKQYSSIKQPSHAEKLAAIARHPRKAIQKVNVERQSRKAVSYRQGMARYKKSETAKIVEARAAGRCEVQTEASNIFAGRISCDVTPLDGYVRCPNTRADGYELQDHHLTYLRFGGDELPEDICKSCKPHHDLIEARKGKSRARFALLKKRGTP